MHVKRMLSSSLTFYLLEELVYSTQTSAIAQVCFLHRCAK